jgi:tetratricopeptide (TPR) repeat protein
MIGERARLEEHRDLAQRDLLELEEQEQLGEVDPARAEALRANYQAEIDEVDEVLLNSVESAESESEGASIERERQPRRYLVGTLLVMAVLTVAILMAGRAVIPDGGGSTAEDFVADPGSITNEQLEEVVSANPEISAMRMALADRYFDGQQFGAALDHYLFITENNPTPAEESRALSRIGWMAYITGAPEAADQYVRAGIDLDATNVEAKLFLGFVTLYGLGNPVEAIPLLEEVAALPELPLNILTQVEDALAEAQSQAENGG